MTTRSRDSTDYLGTTLNKGSYGSKLPSKGQVLSFFLYLHINSEKTIRESATTVVNEISEFCERAKIPSIRKDTALTKVEKLCKLY